MYQHSFHIIISFNFTEINSSRLLISFDSFLFSSLFIVCSVVFNLNCIVNAFNLFLRRFFSFPLNWLHYVTFFFHISTWTFATVLWHTICNVLLFCFHFFIFLAVKLQWNGSCFFHVQQFLIVYKQQHKIKMISKQCKEREKEQERVSKLNKRIEIHFSIHLKTHLLQVENCCDFIFAMRTK